MKMKTTTKTNERIYTPKRSTITNNPYRPINDAADDDHNSQNTTSNK